MTKYEWWSLALTGVYDLLTLLLLVFVVYEALIKPRQANIALYIQRMPEDTKQWGWQRELVDFILENRAKEIKNVRITSEPDFIGWDNLGKDGDGPPRSTSQFFKQPIPYLGQNERLQFFWCDMEANIEVLRKPFEITIEFDNPVFPLPRRVKKRFKFDFSALDGTVFGMTERYDIHNVAREAARIREQLEGLNKTVSKMVSQIGQDKKDTVNNS
jgi:hypothetical protein